MIHCAGGSGRTGMVVAAVVKVCYCDEFFSFTNRGKFDAFITFIAQVTIKFYYFFKNLMPKKLSSVSFTSKKAQAAILK